MRPLLFIVLGFAAVPVGIAVCLACGLEPWAAALVAGGAALPLLLIGFRLAEKAPEPPPAPTRATPSEPPPPDPRTGLRELARVAVLALFAGFVTFAAGAQPIWVIVAVATCVCGWVVLFGGAGHIAPQLVLLFLGVDGPDPTRGSTRFVFGFVWALLVFAVVYSWYRGGK